MGNHRQSHSSYASSSYALECDPSMSQLSRPLCFMCNMELDLHLTLGEPGSTETVCPVIVQAAALPDHHGPYAVGSPSQPSFVSSSSSRSHSYESTKSSRSSGGGGSSSSHSHHKSSRHTGSSTSKDGHAHSSSSSSKSKRSSGKSHSHSHSHRSGSPSRKQHHHHNAPYSPTAGTEQDALRYSQVLPVQSFLFEEAWRSSD